MSVLVFRQTLEIPVRDYTIWSNKVRPYDLKAPIIDYTLCHMGQILYRIYSRLYTIFLYTIDYILYTRPIYLYTIARPLKGGNQVLHTSLRAMW